MEKILIVDDESFIRENVERILGEEGYHVISAIDGSSAIPIVQEEEIDLVLLDLNLGNEHGIDVLRRLREIDPELLVIIITGYGTVESAVDSLKMGAFHYMKKPFKADALKVIVKLALQTSSLKREMRTIRQGTLELFEKIPLVGASSSLAEIIRQAREVAQFPSATVLLTGESGTGKELIAKSIHHLSDRREAPFVEINCASIPVTLLESELFGHEKGAFTDAGRSKAGLFESANKGTIFLDEIGEMDPVMQAKLLRVLENRRLRRVGGNRDIEIDVRVIAATNRNLKDAIKEGRFREDLYYRLNVVPIHLPALRERREDIPLLATFYLEKYSRNFSRSFRSIHPDAISAMEHYSWPGNVRELKNVIEKICIMHNGQALLKEHLPPDLTPQRQNDATTCFAQLPEDIGLDQAVEAYESSLIRFALDKSGGNVLQAAAILRIPRGTLRYKMEKYGF